jgi:crotonobetainyl-CoA hydratase
MASGMREPLLAEHHGHTLVLTLNRPEVRNAVNRELAIALGEALEEAERTPEVRVVILTGAGEAFCAGADLKALAAGEPVMPGDERDRWGFACYTSHPIGKPTIAAVNGVALAGGTELVLASDLAVASEEAAFGLPEVTRGIIAAAGGAFRLGQQIPKKIAMELILTGERIDARRAHELGLLNRVVPPGDVLGAAHELAERMVRNAPLAVQASKRLANGIVDGAVPGEEAAWELSQRENTSVFESEDAREGPRAFAEKRDPLWQAR